MRATGRLLLAAAVLSGASEMRAEEPESWNNKALWIGCAEPLPGARGGPTARDLTLDAAQWIWAVGEKGDVPPRTQAAQNTGTRYAFQKTVDCGKDRIEWAVLRLSIDGTEVEVRVNGKLARLIQANANADSWLLPVDVDVAEFLKPGENAIEVSIRQSREECAFGFQGALCWKPAGGTAQRTVTDRTWTVIHESTGGTRKIRPMNNWTVPRRSSRIRTDHWGQTEATPLLRREFSAGGSIKSAVVSVCGLGFYELRLNGARVGDRVMDPAFTHYGKRALYVTHDVTALLREGANALGLILGNGWYSPPNYDWFDFDIASWRGPPKARLQLRIEYADGRVEWVLSDGGWKAARSPVVCDGIRNGELYDARLEQAGWDAPGFDASSWKPATVLDAPAGRLVEMKMPPERVVEVLEAANIRETGQHTFVYTFPKNVSGWPRLRATGPRGTRVTMRCYEVDDNRHDGHLTREGPFQTDTYILKGEGVETYEPRFAYHGFQFVELTGYPGEPDGESLKAAVVHTDFESAGSFASSLPVFNALQAMTRNSYLSNYHGFPTDCPTREKGGWTADAYLAAETGLLNFDSLSSYSKWLDDILDCQHADGRVPDIVPTASWGYNGFFDWDCVIIYLPWYVYVYTGDREPMERAYEGMKRCYEYYFAKATNGILDDGRGDWCPETTVTPKAVTTTAMLADCARLLARMSALLGKTGDEALYKERAATVAAAYVREFVKDDGTVANGSQTAQSCALYFDLVPEDKRAPVLAKLVDAVKAAKGHLDVGIFGAKYLFTVLSENGHHDLACEIVSDKSYPGYGWWADQGFTTLPESWSCDNSLNHIMFGDISAWFYRHLAGIQPVEDAPGFREFLIRPRPWKGLDHAGAEHQSPHGRIASEWKRVAKKIEYRIEVPEGTEARVVLEGGDGPFETTVGPGKHTFVK